MTCGECGIESSMTESEIITYEVDEGMKNLCDECADGLEGDL